MSKKGNAVRAEFCRGSSPSIDVHLAEEVQPVSLFRDNIEVCSEALGESEIETAINILIFKKSDMLKQHNFPPIYAEMLTDLIEVQRNRYGKHVKKDKMRRLGYSVSGGKLEEILGEYLNIQSVHIHSIDVGNDRYNTERINLESDDSYLVLSFREAEDEKKISMAR